MTRRRSVPRLECPLLVALDIDGTISADGSADPRTGRGISVAVREAIAAVMDGNAVLVLCTGRLAPATIPFLHALDVRSGYAVCSNGAVVIDAATGCVVRSRTFELAAVVADASRRMPGAVFCAEAPGEGVRVTGSVTDTDTCFGTVQTVGVDELIQEPTSRLAIHWPGHSPVEVAEALRGFSVGGVRCWVYPGECFADVTAGDVTKASALEALRSTLAVPVHRTLAVGDGINDIEMLRWAGWGVAMGHAPDVVRAAADEVCAPVSDDGLAMILGRWFG